MLRLSNSQAMRTAVVCLFIVLYTFLALFIVIKMQRECLSAKEIARELSFLKEKGNIKLENPNNLSYIYHVNDELPVSELLGRGMIPNTVYYVWCGKRWFEFPHYLSVLSVMKNIRPDNLVFFYDVRPVVDDWMYNTWFNELQDKFPFIRLQQIANDDKGCINQSNPNIEFIQKLLFNRGGIYINEKSIITNLPPLFRNFDVVDALYLNGGIGFIMAKQGHVTRFSRTYTNEKRFKCVHVDEYTSQITGQVSCVYHTKNFYPKDIWLLNSTFGQLARSIFYGTSKTMHPTPSNSTLIPNIAHVVWLGGGSMDFLFLLCVLSLLNVAKVEALYLHGDKPPTGPYWDLVKNHDRLHLIYRDYPGTVYKTDVHVVAHITDVWRVDFMIKYGGIYVDTDSLFVKPLDDKIRQYDAVSTYDWTHMNHPFPNIINFGVSIGKRNAKFWHLFQESMKLFIDKDWTWNGVRQPYKVQEKHPDLILIDPHLSVICFKSLCHPTWLPDYHNESIHHLNRNRITNWKEDVYAFHWTYPTPFELLNYANLMKADTMFSQIGKHVLNESNLLRNFQQEVEKVSRRN